MENITLPSEINHLTLESSSEDVLCGFRLMWRGISEDTHVGRIVEMLKFLDAWKEFGGNEFTPELEKALNVIEDLYCVKEDLPF